MMYPREIEFSEVSKYNPILAKQLITRKEFRDIYNMYVIQIPTNKPVIREDFKDLITNAKVYKKLTKRK